jgi:hypothetical protein
MPALIPVRPILDPLNPQDADVIYAEDFNGGGASLAWTLEPSDTEFATVERSLEGGAYRWKVRAKQDMFTMVQADQPTQPPNPHFIYSVKARLQNAPDSMAYGLLFYVQDPDNLFYIKVTQAGKYRLYAMQNNEWEPVTDAAASEDLHTGPNAENWLALERRADWVAFYINGVEQVEWTLADYPGGFGLAVELDAGDSATIFWDDIIISE